MAQTLNCTFSVTQWDEQVVVEEQGGYKTSKAAVAYRYDGDIVGEAKAEFILMYQPDETAVFTAVEKIEGTFNGKPGTIILTHSGVHDDAARGHCVIARAYGSMAGLSGSGNYVAAASTVELTLTIES